MALQYFQGGNVTIKIADESVVVLDLDADFPMKTYYRHEESVNMIFNELWYEWEAFTEVTQKEYDDAVEEYKTLLPF